MTRFSARQYKKRMMLSLIVLTGFAAIATVNSQELRIGSPELVYTDVHEFPGNLGTQTNADGRTNFAAVDGSPYVLKNNNSTIPGSMEFYLPNAAGFDEYIGTLERPLGEPPAYGQSSCPQWAASINDPYAYTNKVGNIEWTDLPGNRPGKGEIRFIVNVYRIPTGPNAGDLLGFVHVETGHNDANNPGSLDFGNFCDFYSSCHYSIGLAYSKKGLKCGIEWTFLGTIIEPDVSLGANNTTNQFCIDEKRPNVPGQDMHNIGGVAYIVIGDYFYVYFAEYSVSTTGIGVARGKISTVLQDAVNNRVGLWQKWLGGTSWTSSARSGNGASKSVIPASTTTNYTNIVANNPHSDAVFCKKTNRYYLTINGGGLQSGTWYQLLLLYSSFDGLTWESTPKVLAADANYAPGYPFFASNNPDDANDDHAVGSTFYIYYFITTSTGLQPMYRVRIDEATSVGDLAIGKNGSAFCVGFESDGANFSLKKWDGKNKNWNNFTPPQMGLKTVVDQSGNPYVLQNYNILKWTGTGTGWTTVATGGCFDMSMSGKGTFFGLGGGTTGERIIVKQVSGNWFNCGNTAFKIAVDPNDNPWIIKSDLSIQRFNGSGWDNAFTSWKATDIAIGPNLEGSNPSVYIVGTDIRDLNGFSLYKYNFSTGNWDNQNVSCVKVVVDQNNRPWIVKADQTIWQWDGSTQWLSVNSTKNLALCGIATASSSSSTNSPNFVIDNSTSTLWSTGVNGWLQIDLGASCQLTRTEVAWETSGAYKYKIEVSSDNATWPKTPAVVKTTNTSAQTFTDYFTATGRYVKITATGLPASSARISEFRIFGTKPMFPNVDKWYKVLSKSNSSYGLNVNGTPQPSTITSVNTATYSNVNLKQWKFMYSAYDESFQIATRANTSYVIGTYKGGVMDNGLVEMEGNGGVDSQKWRLLDAGSGYYYIASKIATNGIEYDLNIPGSILGSQIITYHNDGRDNSKWSIVEVP